MPFVTPQDVQQLQAHVRAQRDELAASFDACPEAQAKLGAQWGAQVAAVDVFLAADPSWLHTAAQMDAGEQLERDLAQWPARFKACGCSNVPPEPAKPDPTGLEQAGHAAIEVAEAAAVLVGLILVVQLARRR